MLKLCLFLVSIVTLSACGGDSDDSGPSAGSTLQSGVFIDSAVEGLRFETTSQSGMTDANGTFQYKSGETVSFFIGDILIGSAVGGSQITPIELVPGATNANNTQVTNILRFMQSLDEDNNPANGIRISASVTAQASGQSLDFSLSPANFEIVGDAQLAFLTSGSVTALIPTNTAQTHFLLSIGSGSGGIIISGADTGVIGTEFESSVTSALISNGLGDVSWAGTPGEEMKLSISDSDISTLQFIEVAPSNINDVYAYFLDCFPNPSTTCPNVTLDISAKTLTLDNVSLPVTTVLTNNIATAPVVVNGVLSWE